MRTRSRLFALLAAVTAVAIASLGLGGVNAATQTSLRFTALATNAATEPLGIDDATPRLSWAFQSDARGVTQEAFQVLVASSAGPLQPGSADLWDSGVVETADPFVVYEGTPLQARTRYQWAVRVWAGGVPSAWSEPASFETAYLDPGQWRGDWISGPQRKETQPTAVEATLDDACCRQVLPVPVPVPILGEGSDYCRPSYNKPNSGQCAEIRPAPMLRRGFPVEPASGPRGEVVAARLYSAGLAYNQMTINGVAANDGKLDPGFTSYDKTVLYTTTDVTALIAQHATQQTTNVVASVLGSGQFDNETTSGDWGWEKAEWRSTPTLIADLYVTYADGSEQLVASDGTWKVTDAGPTRYDNYYLGETYDARKAIAGWDTPGFDTGTWASARVVNGPAGKLSAQKQESTRVVASWPPGTSTTPSPGMVVFDTGQQRAGWATVSVHGAPRGTPIQVRYGDKLTATGLINDSGYKPSGQIQTDVYLSDGTGTAEVPEIWAPRFTYKGFQYVQLSSPQNTALPAGVTVAVVSVQEVRTDLRQTATFATSSALLNRIEANSRASIKENYVGSIITDTPTYEKNGWAGDAQLSAATASLLFDTERQYWKIFQDLVDDQLATGDVPLVSPGNRNYGYFDGPAFKPALAKATPIWDAYWFVIPWESYQRYGDARGLALTYPAMRKYLDEWIPQWLTADGSADHTIDSGLGDWTAPTGADAPAGTPAGQGTNFNTPRVIPLSSTAYLAYMARIAADTARVLGKLTEAAHFDELFENIKTDFNARWWDPAVGYYRETAPCDRCPAQPTLVQAAQVLPLAFGMVPEERRAELTRKLVEDMVVTRQGHAMVGIAGMRWILPVLSDAAHDGIPGAAEAAYSVALQRTYPSFGYWDSLGWTSLGEYWEASSRTRNHHMHGSIAQWFYEDLVGIQPAEPGYATVEVKPTIAAGLDQASATYDSVRGPISAGWRQDVASVEIEITIPANMTGVVWIPARSPGDVLELGTGAPLVADSAPSVRYIGTEDGYVRYEIGSGSYQFRAPR